MLFPKLVYKCPGPHQCPGGTFSYKQILNLEEFKNALKDLWAETIEVAQGIENGAILFSASEEFEEVVEDETIVDKIPEVVEETASSILFKPTREELEFKAGELGIKFDGRTADRTLLGKIEIALSQHKEDQEEDFED